MNTIKVNIKTEPNISQEDNLSREAHVHYEGLDEEERSMKALLLEAYKKDGRKLVAELRKWREENPDRDLGDSIRALF